MSNAETCRDNGLMACISMGRFVHLTFLDGHVEQGWVHLHGGRLHTCSEERRDRCDILRQDIADKLYDGVMREYPPMDVEHLIRIDVAVTASGHYAPIWHDPEHADRYHILERSRLACCP